MTRPTSTRAQLRRAIAMRLMMPFARRFPTGYSTIGTVISGLDAFMDSDLKQGPDFWSGHWLYHIPTGEVRQILSSYITAFTISVKLERPIATLVVGQTYEIHTVFNALEIHEAINQAIRAGYPSFFETVEDKSLVVCEDKLEYDLTSIAPSVGIVHSVALERPTTRLYVVAGGTSFTPGTLTWRITFTDTDLSDVQVGWRVSFYDGGGRGTQSVITAKDSDSISFLGAADDGITAFDKMMLWDPNDEKLDWYRMKHIYFDTKEWPSQLRFYAPIYAYRGSRLRIKHSTVPTSLAAEAATTVVPQEYIIPKAVSILAKTRVGDNRVDRQRYAAMAEEYGKEAEEWKKRNFFRLPDMEMWMEGKDLPDELVQDPQGDPLNWR